MTTPPTLDIKVIYDASSGRRSAPARSARTARRNHGSLSVALGLGSLVVAGLFYYATWWRVDQQIYLKLLLHTPIEGVNAADVSRLFGIPPEPAPQRGLAGPDDPKVAASAQATQVLLGATGYGWLTLSTLSVCGIALVGGAFVARGSLVDLQRIGLILGVGVLLALAWGVVTTWVDYGREYKPYHLRYAMSGPVALSACLGLVFFSRAQLFSRVAGISLIIAALGSVAALWLGHRCDAIEAAQISIPFLALVFAAHSLWGWILLGFGARATR